MTALLAHCITDKLSFDRVFEALGGQNQEHMCVPYTVWVRTFKDWPLIDLEDAGFAFEWLGHINRRIVRYKGVRIQIMNEHDDIMYFI